jgi:hypothetical protein
MLKALPHDKYVVFLPKINQLVLLGETVDLHSENLQNILINSLEKTKVCETSCGWCIQYFRHQTIRHNAQDCYFHVYILFSSVRSSV